MPKKPITKKFPIGGKRTKAPIRSKIKKKQPNYKNKTRKVLILDVNEKITPTEPETRHKEPETVLPELIILFKVTSRSRPEKFKFTINNIIENCVNPAYYILASIDTEDTSTNTDDIKQFCKERNVLLMHASNWDEVNKREKTKIEAINRDMNDNPHLPNWDILVNVSDDQYFTVKGFDDIIRTDFESHIPDLDGIMHYPDGNRSDLMTMSIMGKPWYDRFKRIYYEKYVSVRCDDDAMQEAKAWQKHEGKKHYHFSDRNILVHAHPAYGKAAWDDQYRKTEHTKVHKRDKEIYDSREFYNFGIPGFEGGRERKK